VGIRGGKIVQISEQPLKGKETIDAPGLVVAPGFIDLHQHGQNAENDAAKAADGVTTSLEMEANRTRLL
jgi:N-acyl-D-aspartate/D-glutamate deacylase